MGNWVFLHPACRMSIFFALPFQKLTASSPPENSPRAPKRKFQNSNHQFSRGEQVIARARQKRINIVNPLIISSTCPKNQQWIQATNPYSTSQCIFNPLSHINTLYLPTFNSTCIITINHSKYSSAILYIWPKYNNS